MPQLGQDESREFYELLKDYGDAKAELEIAEKTGEAEIEMNNAVERTAEALLDFVERIKGTAA